ncbi:hypothetical protein IV66_GL001040 [Ligilactobacillus pobuzihii]|uniref:Uncharacterized protein n=2 Tax=Ligilactobacillus pobuzihii TaxID=449659 RepID=A0A0R2L8A7_9LACO|nr:hypothetical protein IV66_GL001040 [Ligilactobacillus pobuzihii]
MLAFAMLINPKYLLTVDLGKPYLKNLNTLVHDDKTQSETAEFYKESTVFIPSQSRKRWQTNYGAWNFTPTAKIPRGNYTGYIDVEVDYVNLFTKSAGTF